MATSVPQATDRAVSATRIGYVRWVICGLLFLAATINYIDRQVIGILKPTLTGEFGWSEIDYADIVFAFRPQYDRSDRRTPDRSAQDADRIHHRDRHGPRRHRAVRRRRTIGRRGSQLLRLLRRRSQVHRRRFMLGSAGRNFPASIKTVAEVSGERASRPETIRHQC